VGIVVGVVTFLIAIQPLETCSRALLIIAGTALTVCLIIFRILRPRYKSYDQTRPQGSSRWPTFRAFLKHNPLLVIGELFSILLFILCVILFLSPGLLGKVLPACASSKPAPAVPTNLPVSLVKAHLDFMVTLQDGTQVKIPEGIDLVIAPKDKIEIAASVTTEDGSDYPHELSLHFYFASGGDAAGETATYIARQAGTDLITVLVMDKLTLEQAIRNIRVVVK
jgi:hypothetical protein